MNFLLGCLLLFYLQLSAQSPERLNESMLTIASIHPIERPQHHYADLQTLSGNPQGQFAWMDTITYPPELYRNSTLLFALAKPHYLTSSQVDYLVRAVRFPANSSEQTRAELDYLLELQNNRTEAQVERVLALAQIGYWPNANYLPTHPYYKTNLENLFFELRELIGEECTAENYPKTSELLQGIMNDMRLMEFAVKYHLLRARPYQLEPKLEPLKTINSPSFASGHTLWAYIQAYTLGELIPNKRNAFVELAYEIGESREIMGVHYPSDEEAARQLAHRMLLLMWHTEKFQSDFKAARTEWQ
ncbi:MAG: phosphatase PAP2 family protein [Bacteroidota bacterium]